MNITRTYHLALTLFAVLFLAAQSFSLAHATVHGDDPHDHEGVACAVTLLAEDGLAVLPDVPVSECWQVPTPAHYKAVYSSAIYVTPQSRAPPPRAPPATL